MHFGKKIGIIGEGQLGKMMITPANLLGFETLVYCETPESPACTFANEVTIGEYSDKTKLLNFASKCDFLTIEFEAANVDCLKAIEKEFPEKLSPNSNAVFISQNRLREKIFFREAGVKTAEFAEINTSKQALDFFKNNGKFILKTTENGYDGKGQFLISSESDVKNEIPFEKTQLIAEKFVPFSFEASVILTRSKNGQIVIYPVPINLHKNGILERSIVRETVEPWKDAMKQMTTKIANNLNFVGTMAVEFFVLETGEILANEMAPRPHNSGHFTLDLCNVSQFENHIRAISGLPLIQSKLLFEGEMLNLIGEDVKIALNFLDNPNAKLHLYGKKNVREKRKMGHINFIYDEVFS